MTSLTRGPLSSGVYWRRRLVLLVLALVLFVGIARVLAGGSDASSGPGQAAQVAATPAATGSATLPATPAAPTTTTPPVSPTSSGSSSPQPGSTGSPTKTSTYAPPVLVVPQGTCSDDDVAVTPEVDGAEATSDVSITLNLRTIVSEACTWPISSRHLTLKITSGSDDVWSSLECPRAVPKQDLIVRRDSTTQVVVTWSSRRSDESCSSRTDWAEPGFYHVVAAALAGEPADVQFELAAPAAPTTQPSDKPTAKPSDKPSDKPTAKPSDKPSGKPSDKPTGKATSEPTGRPTTKTSGDSNPQT